MKRIVVLIIASLLVIGLVLPGCEAADDFDQYITLGIAGPMGMAQGTHHMYGAEMARDEINDGGAGGVDVGGTIYGIKLVKIDTNEILNPSGADGVTAMSANIDNVDFVLGGFRTEAVAVYREVAMEAEKIFMNCGAATGALQFSVVTNHADYKYWFKATPLNEIFLGESNTKLLSMITAAVQMATGNSTWHPTVAIIAEDAIWTKISRDGLYQKLLAKGWLCSGAGLWLVNPVAAVGGMGIVLAGINAVTPNKPNMIFTIMSGPCGVTYGDMVGTFANLEDVLTVGINVEAQRQEYPSVAKYAEGMIFLDSWAPGVNITDTTAAFTSAYVTKTGEWPIYTAATYEAILQLVDNIETANSLVTDTLIPVIEASTRVGTSGKSGYYPLWDGSTTGANPFGAGQVPALNQTQVLDLYPWLPDAVYSPDGINKVAWTYNSSDWTMAPHTTHDLVYGTEWVTGVASQWQWNGTALVKTCIWPQVLQPALPSDMPTWLAVLGAGVINATTLYSLQAAGLWDQYGWYNFAYDGTVAPDLTDWITWLIISGQV